MRRKHGQSLPALVARGRLAWHAAAAKKRGGARLIYFIWTARRVLFLLDIYAKNEKEVLSDADKKDLRRTLAALQAPA